MLTNCVSILETRFFRIFHVFFNCLMLQDENFRSLAFKKDTDLKKRATLTILLDIMLSKRSDAF
jgi:hypothetical protein